MKRQKSWRLPFVVWARLYHDLAPFLAERIAEGMSVISFYHRQVANAVEEQLLKPHRKERHGDLATYFQRELATPMTRGKVVASLRALAELPYQHTHAEQYGELEQTLCNLDFVERKITVGQFYDLQMDLHRGNTFCDSKTLRTLEHRPEDVPVSPS